MIPGSSSAESFQSTLPARGATGFDAALYDLPIISIHAPRTGSDIDITGGTDASGISIHAPRTGSDSSSPWRRQAETFQSTLPARGATPRFSAVWLAAWTISIHAPRTGSDNEWIQFARTIPISIHDPRTGSDGEWNPRRRSIIAISIHAPRTGSDNCHTASAVQATEFQSTLPARGATMHRRQKWISNQFQSTLPARGATLVSAATRFRRKFQSTLPARGATCGHGKYCRTEQISIHAPRTGSDTRGGQPHGANAPFQSTLPARGATPPDECRTRNRPISIHAPRTGSDASQSSRSS